MIKWVFIILLVAVCWTAYEKGKDWVDDYGFVGLCHATEKNMLKGWNGLIGWFSNAETNFEKNHPEFLCGKKGCEKK